MRYLNEYRIEHIGVSRDAAIRLMRYSQMHLVTEENKKTNPDMYRYSYRVIVTDASGRVLTVSRRYKTEKSAEKRAEKEPAVFATVFEYPIECD